MIEKKKAGMTTFLAQIPQARWKLQNNQTSQNWRTILWYAASTVQSTNLFSHYELST